MEIAGTNFVTLMEPIASATSALTRCPACGQRTEEGALERCPLCGAEFEVERAATSDDTTPFAHAYAQDLPGHRRMWKWVWTAPAGRLKHLALMRTSAAARSFSRLYWLMLSAGLGMLMATQKGWKSVFASAAIGPAGSIKPRGRGWLHVAEVPTPLRVTRPGIESDLWWNPAQTMISGVAGFLSAFAVLWVLFVLLLRGVRRAHQPRYRHEGRMSAALHYSAAWSVPVLVILALLIVRPLARVGEIARWDWYPGRSTMEYLAAIGASITFVLWWFWLLRLGATAPADSRGRVEWFFGLGVPLMVGLAAAGWWLGMDRGLTALFEAWKLHF